MVGRRVRVFVANGCIQSNGTSKSGIDSLQHPAKWMDAILWEGDLLAVVLAVWWVLPLVEMLKTW